MWPAVWIWVAEFTYQTPETKKKTERAIECSYDAVRIANRLLDHPETLPDIDRPNQLLRRSEIAPIEDGGPAFPHTHLPAERVGSIDIRKCLRVVQQSIGDAYGIVEALNRRVLD